MAEKNCPRCDGFGYDTTVIIEPDQQGEPHAYYEACDMCDGTGFIFADDDEEE